MDKSRPIFVKFIPEYFVLLDAIWNVSLFLKISFLGWLLQVYKNAVGLYLLIFYPVPLLNSF